MLNNDYAAFTIWKTNTRELDCKLELRRLVDEAKPGRPALFRRSLRFALARLGHLFRN